MSRRLGTWAKRWQARWKPRSRPVVRSPVTLWWRGVSPGVVHDMVLRHASHDQRVEPRPCGFAVTESRTADGEIEHPDNLRSHRACEHPVTPDSVLPRRPALLVGR